MDRKSKGTIGLVVLAALAAAGPAEAAAFINGSFEMGADPGSSTQLNFGSTAISGWTVGGNSIDYVGTAWSARDGARSVDLSGIGAGNLAQTFDTQIGRRYTATFFLAGNPAAGPLTKSIRTTATGNTAQIDRFNASGSTVSNMGWRQIEYHFTATTASTTLRFASLNEGSAGPAIDNVSIASVPEASMWATMMLGFGCLGAALRTRPRKVLAVR